MHLSASRDSIRNGRPTRIPVEVDRTSRRCEPRIYCLHKHPVYSRSVDKTLDNANWDQRHTQIAGTVQDIAFGMNYKVSGLRDERNLLPIGVLLRLIKLVKKSVLSRKFYQEINDKVLASSSTVDTNLYFICYFSLLLSSVLNNKPKIKAFLVRQKNTFFRLLGKLIQQVTGSHPKDLPIRLVPTLFQEKEPVPDVNDSKIPVSKLAVHLKSISSYISDVRIFNRLTDSIKYMPWIIDEFQALVDPSNTVPKSNRMINFLQSINCLVLEILENAGWLTDHNWIGTNDNNWWSMFTYVWCSRVWGVYLLLEIIEIFRRGPLTKWDNKRIIMLVSQLSQVPLVLHWSLYEGCLNSFWVGVCGSLASWWKFRDMWSSIDLS